MFNKLEILVLITMDKNEVNIKYKQIMKKYKIKEEMEEEISYFVQLTGDGNRYIEFDTTRIEELRQEWVRRGLFEIIEPKTTYLSVDLSKFNNIRVLTQDQANNRMADSITDEEFQRDFLARK